MPVAKGGVWTNIEDEILKASISKYGLNQWARVSSLLARKTPKQCKARWTEWLDPAIRKVEWSREEDERLLHLARVMPMQWRTIGQILGQGEGGAGRTANQCLERYSRLLDEAEDREDALRKGEDLGLRGQEGGETRAPTGDDVRRLRPGELDPDPESKPAKPDAIDMDEDEKEMLSEARARLANTQGKKAKRKARERQLEESRRLAVLQKRRELKSSGINLKLRTTGKKGGMDYNADVPFEKAPAQGFYDTLEEKQENEKERDGYDPRKQQLERKRRGDADDQEAAGGERNKRRKEDEAEKERARAAARAGQLQKMREIEKQGKRKALNLPAPQVSEAELDDIVKMGIAGSRAATAVGQDGDSGLIQQYSSLTDQTSIRTPMTAPREDRVAQQIRDIQALNNTTSSLLGGENTPLHQATIPNNTDSAARRAHFVTPNPMATPFRQIQSSGPGMTPMRTPRDHYGVNAATLDPKSALRAKLASLPKPKATEFELELPQEQIEPPQSEPGLTIEDQSELDRRAEQARSAEAKAEFARQTQVIQRSLPRPMSIDLPSLSRAARSLPDPIRSQIAQEAALLMAYDANNFSSKPGGPVKPSLILLKIGDEFLSTARNLIATELSHPDSVSYKTGLVDYFANHDILNMSTDSLHTNLPARFTSATSADFRQAYTLAAQTLVSQAGTNNARSKTLSLHLGGYMARQKTLKKKINETYESLLKEREKIKAFRHLQVGEEAGLQARLERLREEVSLVSRREREAQEDYRAARDRADNGIVVGM